MALLKEIQSIRKRFFFRRNGASTSKSILRRDENNIIQRSSKFDENESIEGALTSSIVYEIPILGLKSSKTYDDENYNKQLYGRQKHVEFVETNDYNYLNNKQNQQQKQQQYQEQQQKTTNMYAAHKASTSNININQIGANNGLRQRFQDEDLFLKLEESIQNEQQIEEKLNKQLNENRKLMTVKDDMEKRLRLFEGTISSY